jgi:hypothetical protein
MHDDERRRGSRERDVSWRDIDKKRDKSAHIDPDRRDAPRKPGSRPVTGPGRYKADLSALFERGEVAKSVKGVARIAGLEVTGGQPERQAALRRILDAVGPDAVCKAVDAFRKEHGELPDDPDVLVQMLVHPDPDTVLDALGRLERYLAGHIPHRKAIMLGRVKEAERRADSAEIERVAARVRDLLGG